jgi:hypothetical protein
MLKLERTPQNHHDDLVLDVIQCRIGDYDRIEEFNFGAYENYKTGRGGHHLWIADSSNNHRIGMITEVQS